MTKENIGKSIAITLDGYIYSYPTVQNEITGGNSQITGRFTPEQAKDLANVLKSGKMPAPARIVQEDVVGPSLGDEAINNGVWSFAIAGILIKAFWVYCPKWVSSVLYIGMGWTCVLAFTQLLNSLSPAAFVWLLAGGIIYTVGGVIYALKLPIFNSKHKYFGSHEIFHLFVMAGSACHLVVMYAFVL